MVQKDPATQRDRLKRAVTVLDALGAGYDLAVARKALLNLGER